MQIRGTEFWRPFTLALITSFCAWSLSSQHVFAAKAQHSSPTLEDLHAAETDSAMDLNAVKSQSRLESIINPNASEWNRTQEATIPLLQQSVVAPHGGGTVRDVSVKVLRLEEGMAFRLEWRDDTLDNGTKRNAFSDAAAIEFPIDKSGDTRLAMGHSGGPVNILYWRAETNPLKGQFTDQAQELVAAGIHNRGAKPDNLQRLRSESSWRNRKWCVVIFKPFNNDDEASPKFEPNSELPIAFAVWNGGAGERRGLKSVSNWYVLRGM